MLNFIIIIHEIVEVIICVIIFSVSLLAMSLRDLDRITAATQLVTTGP
jgi:hypothetical protein